MGIRERISFNYQKDKVSKKMVSNELKSGKEVIFLDPNGRKIVTFSTPYQFKLYSQYYNYLFR